MDAPSVLIVEDDPMLSELVAGLLTQSGYHPVTIADHALIGAAVERWQPRCVILDGEVRSTGASRSWDDATAIRRSHPALPVVMFTADRAALAEARTGGTPRSRAAGFAGMVGKPFVIEEFLATVKHAIEGPSATPAPLTRQDGAGTAPVRVYPDVGRLAPDWPDADLLSTIVHELRSPLTVIRGQAQLALRRVGQDPARERAAMQSAIAQVDRMDRLITELQDHARLASNGLSLDVVVLDLVHVLDEVIAAQEYEATPRIRFRRPAAGVRVIGDPDRISQILGNLLDNALKYSAPAAPVDVSLTTEGGEAQVRVADHGVGIPEEERGLLFTPFFRASSTRHLRGTGLGLHISRQLADRHRGRMWLEASSSQGSVFALGLPIAAAGR